MPTDSVDRDDWYSLWEFGEVVVAEHFNVQAMVVDDSTEMV
jgi:hypothetical protein